MLVESNKLKRLKNAKSWLVQLVRGTKRKVIDYISDFEFILDGQTIRIDLNILPLGSYDMTVGMDWLERHKSILNCYTNILSYKDDSGTTRTTQSIPKPVSVRQIFSDATKEMYEKGMSILCHPSDESIRKGG
jgi:hypothetical protein